MQESPLTNDTPVDGRRDRSTTRESARHSPARSDTSVEHGTSRNQSEKSRRAKRLITRKSHRKSRSGCQNCKTRRIKCDESKSQCSNCTNRNISCDYLLNGPSEDQPSSTAHDDTVNIPDLELMYHWTTSTVQSLSAWYSGAVFWQTNMTELMLLHSHTLHLSFALTALHLAYCRPLKHNQYIALADRHYNLGLPHVTKALANISPDNCDAVYQSVQLICFITFARGPQPGEYLAFGSSGSSEWLIMFRGIKTTITTVGDQHFKRTHASTIENRSRPLRGVETPTDFEERLADMRAHVKFLSTGTKHLEDDLHAVDVLIDCYRNRYNEVDGEYHIVFAWLYRMSEEFLDRLQQYELVPLIVFGYFIVLIHELERFWYMKGWTHHCMSGVFAAMPDPQRVWIRWPMAQVGWISP